MNTSQSYVGSCADMRFDVLNYKLDLGVQYVEIEVGIDSRFAMSNQGTLYSCPEDMTIANSKKIKCASNDKKFKRKWANAKEMIRGVHYQKALSLYLCETVILVGFNEAVYLETINTEE